MLKGIVNLALYLEAFLSRLIRHGTYMWYRYAAANMKGLRTVAHITSTVLFPPVKPASIQELPPSCITSHILAAEGFMRIPCVPHTTFML